MKKIIGLDLGTNSIGWSLIMQQLEKEHGEIIGLGSRIIPMSQDVLGKFEAGQTDSQTAVRTAYRGVRRLYLRDNLRRERLHRVLNILDFLPQHYSNEIDFKNKLGQFKKEIKLNYFKNDEGKYEFLFKDSFNEMTKDFKNRKIPYDWTLYYLRKKALSQKISKEELSWLLLNFNQKRGYYQLRGDEEEEQENKTKSFETLKVAKTIATGDTIKNTDTKLYEVYFDNGWKYDKLITKIENWNGKIKEFIVSTSTNKDGSIKRTYKAVDSEKDWIAIKKKTEQQLNQYIKKDVNHTVGTFIYETLLVKPTQKIRGKLIKTIERKYYKEELIKILKKQKDFHAEFNDKNLYINCLNELYKHNEAHKNNAKEEKDFFTYLFVDDIIFYQRPLKSKKSTIGKCQFEKRTYKKRVKDDETGVEKEVTIKEYIKAISKSHPLYQEFRIWQWMHNLRIHKKYNEEGLLKDTDITNELLQNDDDYVKLFDFLNKKKEIKQSVLLGHFFKKKEDKENHRWNYPEDKAYPLNTTKAEMVNRLKKIKTIEPNSFLNKKTELQLWHIIYSVKDFEQFKQALKTFAKNNNIDETEFLKAFEKHPPYKNDYGAFSEKALKKIVPLMRRGSYFNEQEISSETKDRFKAILTRVEALKLPQKPTKKEINTAFENYKVADDDIPKQMVRSFINQQTLSGLNTYQATYLIYDRHSEIGDIKPWKTAEDINKFLKKFKQHSLRNPIVEQVVLETLRTVRDIWEFYGNGEKGFFDEIHIELGRELKNPAAKRKDLSLQVSENQRRNERIRLLLKEMTSNGAKPYSPSHLEILKIYEEGVFKNPNAKYNKNTSIKDIEKIRKTNSPTAKDIEKYKLWLEQGYISPYTGKIIPLSKLFSIDYQIEHIIPQSRYFNDSLSNKVICESEVNEDKSNQTAYEYLKQKGGSIVHNHHLLSFEAYEKHCNNYFKKNKAKLRNLLAEEIPEGFINRQLNDSRYIAKFVKSLLGNIVRGENEQEATPKKLISVTGAITSKLKHDWGLNDKWNELILPRFKRLNALTKTEDFTAINTKNILIPTVPDELKKGFNKKRIDHRHHALDALVIAACTQKHIQYINSLNNDKEKFGLQPALMVKNKEGHYTKAFKLPWSSFSNDAKNILDTTIISFKQNLRVINRTNNKYVKYVKQKDGSYKKQLVKQQGKNFAIRKSMHKETVSGMLNEKASTGKIFTAVRTYLSDIKNRKQLNKITDVSIKKILDNHLKNFTIDNKENFEEAFSPEGIEKLNKNIVTLNNGKKHQPIFKVRLKEEGSKFSISHKEAFNKNKKYVEAAKGTNLFFAIYINDKGERVYETIPLFEVIEHQKQQAKENTPKESRTPIPIKNDMGEFLFTLSPNDLVYVPTNEEMANPNLVHFEKLSKEQVDRVYKMVSSSGRQCFFIKANVATTIKNKVEFSALNKMEKDIDGTMVKSVCWKLRADRLGNITNVIK